MCTKDELTIYQEILDVCWDLLDDNTAPNEVIEYLDSRKKDLSDPLFIQYLISLKDTLEEILI